MLGDPFMKTIPLSELPVVTKGFTHEQDIWIQSLEGGEFLQTKEHLRDPHGFCCLGVACYVNRVAFGIQEEANAEGYYTFWSDSKPDDHVDTCLPEVVCDGMHFLGEFGTLRAIVGYGMLSGLNDEKNWTFDMIANLARRAPWTVFGNFTVPDFDVDISD